VAVAASLDAHECPGRSLVDQWRALDADSSPVVALSPQQELPQPQVETALGFSMWNPPPITPST
jgi:hypothetical protein